MNILVMKPCLVFAVIIAILWTKRPLFWVISGGPAAALILYGVHVPDAFPVMGRTLVSRDMVMVVLSFHFTIFLQRMLERRDHLKQAEQSLNWLFNNRRVNASTVPTTIGLLPSAGTMTICAEIARSSCQDYLSNEDMTCATSFYRHIPESSLPTYSSILIALSVSGVGAGEFTPAVLSLVVALFIIGHIFHLRRMPRSTGQKPERGGKKAAVMLFKSPWFILLTVMLLIAFDIPVYVVIPIAAILSIFVDHLKPREIILMFRTVFEPVITFNTILIMMFKDIITYTEVIRELPVFFGGLSILFPMASALMFFFDTIISGPNAIIPLRMPMAITVMPEAGVPLLVLFMGSAYAAMQVPPAHACLFTVVGCFRVDIGALVRESIPMILVLSAATLVYTALLSVF